VDESRIIRNQMGSTTDQKMVAVTWDALYENHLVTVISIRPTQFNVNGLFHTVVARYCSETEGHTNIVQGLAFSNFMFSRSYVSGSIPARQWNTETGNVVLKDYRQNYSFNYQEDYTSQL
jgi:hypothetical protein